MDKSLIENFFKSNQKYPIGCNGCGACVGICPAKALSLVKNKYGFYKVNYDKEKCIACGQCLNICSQQDIKIAKLKSQSDLIGKYVAIYKGYANNINIRKKAFSGGITTTILEYLVINKIVDKVVCLYQKKSYPFKITPIITDNVSIIRKCAGSKYESYPILSIINKLDKKLKYAITALPCHIKAIKKTKINNLFIIGLTCSGNYSQDSVKFFTKKKHINFESINYLNHREGKWPGKLVIKTKNSNFKFNHNRSQWTSFRSSFFHQPACLLCNDLLAEQADLSLADPWGIDKYYQDYGSSIIICRNNNSKKIIQNMVNKNMITIENLDSRKVIKAQKNGLILKKIGIYNRVRLMKFLRFKLPNIQINKPLNNFKTNFLYPLEFFNIFNYCYIKNIYGLIIRLPLKLIFIYRYFLLGLQTFINKLFHIEKY